VIALTLAEVAGIVGGTVHGAPGDAVTVSGPPFLDSRAVEEGGLFVALAGERHDGHDFAEAAVAAGAAAVLGSRPVGVPSVVVSDVVAALGRLTRQVRDRLPQLRVVAITGSQGKTSTKDLLAQVLAKVGPTVATVGNLNNEIGVPLTALRATEDTAYLVLEMGTRGPGQLAYLCEISRPDVSLVLNVGKAHLSEFGTQDAIAAAKGELVEGLEESGTAVLNGDDPRVAAMVSRTRGRVTTYGEGPGSDVRVENVVLDELGRPGLDLVTAHEAAHVQLQVLGEHQAGNAAGAAAAALALGLRLDGVGDALGSATSASRWRMEVVERADGVTVVNDAYNANPDSMRAALKALAAMGRSRAGSGRGPSRTVAVLGEMRELGESSREEHDAVGRLAVRLDVQQLLVVGEEARPIHLGACLEGSWGGESVFVPDAGAALDWLRANITTGDVVLLKASRAAGLEKVAESLVQHGEAAAQRGPTAATPRPEGREPR